MTPQEPVPPPRVRVTSPRTSASRTSPTTPVSEIDARTPLGELYVSALLRAQLRLALGVLLVGVGGLLSLPVVFRVAPAVGDVQVLGMPLSWALLALGAYPLLLGCGWYYVRRAERHEDAFVAMVDRDGDG